MLHGIMVKLKTISLMKRINSSLSIDLVTVYRMGIFCLTQNASEKSRKQCPLARSGSIPKG